MQKTDTLYYADEDFAEIAPDEDYDAEAQLFYEGYLGDGEYDYYDDGDFIDDTQPFSEYDDSQTVIIKRKSA